MESMEPINSHAHLRQEPELQKHGPHHHAAADAEEAAEEAREERHGRELDAVSLHVQVVVVQVRYPRCADSEDLCLLYFLTFG